MESVIGAGMSEATTYGWANHLRRLRSVGARRTRPSAAYIALKGKLSRGQVLLDLGCGDSNDRLIAHHRGVTAYGVDLLPPLKRTTDRFIRADARRLPFANSSVNAAICQALVSLIPPDDRFHFYAEVFRVLKPRGYFSLVFCRLADGWAINSTYESARLTHLGFRYLRAGLYQKGNSNV